MNSKYDSTLLDSTLLEKIRNNFELRILSLESEFREATFNWISIMEHNISQEFTQIKANSKEMFSDENTISYISEIVSKLEDFVKENTKSEEEFNLTFNKEEYTNTIKLFKVFASNSGSDCKSGYEDFIFTNDIHKINLAFDNLKGKFTVINNKIINKLKESFDVYNI